ncbi:DUF1415 family protein [Portibacter marinus]|uniref:DUF1415 family protein n=1 Tax=Portibacter marinus TaxID=2898660 RepID=UPI001F346AE7|nr:DUF1415 family protein [Portibacter marinus]
MESEIINRCMAWARNYVVGLKLCPFASQALEQNAIKWIVESDALKVGDHISTFLSSEYQTLFVIIPFASSFDDYLDLIAMYAEVIDKVGYSDQMKIVTFHPQHQFAATEIDAPVNFANRSPFPMFQLLRQADLKAIGMTEKWKQEILQRNENTLEDLGKKRLNEMLNEY